MWIEDLHTEKESVGMNWTYEAQKNNDSGIQSWQGRSVVKEQLRVALMYVFDY